MSANGPRRDFGWSCWEARSRFNADDSRTQCSQTRARVRSPAGESVTAGSIEAVIYHGCAAGMAVRRLHQRADLGVQRWQEDQHRHRQGVTSFGLTAFGELLLTTIDGRVLRVE